MPRVAQLIAYHRVSTQRQGQFRLGTRGTEAAVALYAAATGSGLIASYTEVESGRKSDRPELPKAIRHAKPLRATLVIANRDRLAGNLAVIANLMDSGVEFVACDVPQASRVTLHIVAAVAEAEALAISTPVREALAAEKARGTKQGASRLGRPRSSRSIARRARLGRRRSDPRAARVLRRCAAGRAAVEGRGPIASSLGAKLDLNSYTTRLGKLWTAIQVSRLLKIAA